MQSFTTWRSRGPQRIDGAALEQIVDIRPRDTDYVVLEVGDAERWRQHLAALPPAQCLIAAAAAGPVLGRALARRLGDDAVAVALCEFLAGPFPPAGPLVRVDAPRLAWLRPLALGGPGDRVEHGLFPARATKLARLLLAAAGAYPTDEVLTAARTAFARDRPYHAHDAIACALVCAGAPARDLVLEMLEHTRSHRGWRSRRKTHALARWARAFGYLDGPTSPARM